MGFQEGRMEAVSNVFSELGVSAEFIPRAGDPIPCTVRFEGDNVYVPDAYQAQFIKPINVIRYDSAEIPRDVYKGEYFIISNTKYYVAEMVDQEAPELTKRCRVNREGL